MLVGIIELIRQFFVKKSKASVQTNPDQSASAPDVDSKITPEYIRQEIDKVPPFQQKDIMKHYQGLSIDWTVEFSSAEEERGDNVRVYFRQGRFSSLLVVCTVRLSDYPQLAITKKGTTIRVKGQIDSIDSLVFRLKNAILIFSN